MSRLQSRFILFYHASSLSHANRHIPLDYGNDIDDDLLVFTQYGQSVRRLPAAFNSARSGIHFWDSKRDTPEFKKHICIGDHVDFATRGKIEMMVQQYWDVFYEAGVSKTVLGFEFAIDTGGSQPGCCRKPSYGPHESKIILEQQNVLLANGWIRKCYGPWGSLIILAPKPHQEDITNIDDFIWRMCVSYRRLNSVTLPFEYPIPGCEDAINDFGDSAGKLYFISLDARSGYHQITVRQCDQEKLAFFSQTKPSIRLESCPSVHGTHPASKLAWCMFSRRNRTNYSSRSTRALSIPAIA